MKPKPLEYENTMSVLLDERMDLWTTHTLTAYYEEVEGKTEEDFGVVILEISTYDSNERVVEDFMDAEEIRAEILML